MPQRFGWRGRQSSSRLLTVEQLEGRCLPSGAHDFVAPPPLAALLSAAAPALAPALTVDLELVDVTATGQDTPAPADAAAADSDQPPPAAFWTTADNEDTPASLNDLDATADDPVPTAHNPIDDGTTPVEDAATVDGDAASLNDLDATANDPLPTADDPSADGGTTPVEGNPTTQDTATVDGNAASLNNLDATADDPMPTADNPSDDATTPVEDAATVDGDAASLNDPDGTANDPLPTADDPSDDGGITPMDDPANQDATTVDGNAASLNDPDGTAIDPLPTADDPSDDGGTTPVEDNPTNQDAATVDGNAAQENAPVPQSNPDSGGDAPVLATPFINDSDPAPVEHALGLSSAATPGEETFGAIIEPAAAAGHFDHGAGAADSKSALTAGYSQAHAGWQADTMAPEDQAALFPVSLPFGEVSQDGAAVAADATGLVPQPSDLLTNLSSTGLADLELAWQQCRDQLVELATSLTGSRVGLVLSSCLLALAAAAVAGEVARRQLRRASLSGWLTTGGGEVTAWFPDGAGLARG